MAPIVTAACLALALAAAAPQPPAGDAGREPKSLILRATHILLVRIESAKPGPWTAQGRRLRTRTVDLRLHVDKALKGAASPDTVEVKVSQSEPALPRVFAVPGVWSGKPLDAGTRYLVFARSDSSQTATVLQEAATLRVTAADAALLDVESALDAERNRWAPSEALAHVGKRRAALGPLFAEYLADRLAGVMAATPSEFDRVMAFVESPGLSAPFRRVAVTDIVTALLMSDPASGRFVPRMAVAGFRILALPDAAALRQELVGTLLPNLLGLQGGATARSAKEVFRDFPTDRVRAEQTLKACEGQPAADLLKWLE